MTVALPTQPRMLLEHPIFESLRARARRKTLWLRQLWSLQGHSSQGLAIHDAEIDRILEPASNWRREELNFYESDAEANRLSHEIAELDSRAEYDAVWQRIRFEFGLGSFEAQLLSLAIAVEADPWWRRVCGYLHDDATANYATPWLAESLFLWENPVRLGPDSPLVSWYLARPIASSHQPWAGTAPWIADPALLGLLKGTLEDPLLGGAVQPAPDPPRRCLYPAVLAEMIATAETVLSEGASLDLELLGPEHSGRLSLAAQLCDQLQQPLLVCDVRAIRHDPDQVHERLVRACRLARLGGTALYWDHSESLEARLWQRRPASPVATLNCFGASSALASAPRSHTVRRSFSLPVLSSMERSSLWQELTGTLPPPAVISSPLLPGELATVALTSSGGDEAVHQACRQILHQTPGELFMPLPCVYGWDDIVLAPTIASHLKELETQARLRLEVLEDWGFLRLTPTARGLSALFSGPSGTGKTMAAQVIASSLGMDLYRVDLSGVVNKYIGETEKRLKQVFDACQRSNVILFLDEADSLCGQRTQVRDAHDRYANIEINYLLQRMEQFDGLAILATNRKGDLDQAFMRRLRFSIDFLPPGATERLAIWQKALPADGPQRLDFVASNIPWSALAERLDLTGAEIKSAALSAAFLARDEKSQISLRHILAAVSREMQKRGQVLRGEQWKDWQ